MSTDAEIGAVVLLRTKRSGEDIARVLGAMEGVSRVERVQGPYDLVIHAAGPIQVEVIERFPWSDRGGSVLAVPSLTRRYRMT